MSALTTGISVSKVIIYCCCTVTGKLCNIGCMPKLVLFIVKSLYGTSVSE